MHWKRKALVQKAIATLPPRASYEFYYRVQRTAGSLRRPVPISRLSAGVRTWQRALWAGHNPEGGVFLEVGTGRVPLVPLAYWLMGAERTITFDLNPYLKQALVRDHLRYITQNRDVVAELFGDLLKVDRFERLMDFASSRRCTTDGLLSLCQIDYHAPADAAATGLPPDSIDFHTSYTTFEHIPREVLIAILGEGNRVLRSGGAFVHRVDYTDHFSHSDPDISSINFLQFSDQEWERYAGNAYMYMNRLRHDDFLRLFAEAGHTCTNVEPDVDPALLHLIQSGTIEVNARFALKQPETLATTAAWLVSTPSDDSAR